MEAFVEQNFSFGFREQVKTIGLSGKKFFINVPPGANKLYENVTMFRSNAPTIKYIQKEGECYCLPFSISSAFHHLGVTQLSSEIFHCQSH